MDYRSGNDGLNDAVSKATGLLCEDKSRTVQAEKDDADINVIMKRFGITGALPVRDRVPLAEGFYGEFDFRASLDVVRAGEAAFMAQPAEVRNKFDNDPGAFLEFFSDPKNTDEAVRLGLATAKPEVKPVVDIVSAKV